MSPTPLISLENVSFARGESKLFKGLSLTIAGGERIGVIGPNGCGKSTLAKLLMGDITPDSGTRVVRKGLRCRSVSQLWEAPRDITVEELLSQEASKAIQEIPELESLEVKNLVAGAVKFANLSGLEESKVENLSGGQKRRLQILIALLGDPHLLVLDEPTNHMDLETTEWLEESILRLLESARSPLWGSLVSKTLPPAFVLVSHDRAVLETLVSKIIEIQPGGLQIFEGNYSDYLEAKTLADLAAQASEQSAANTMRRELEWLSKSPKARSTKQQARIKRAKVLNEKLELMATHRNPVQKVDIDFNQTSRAPHSKQILIETRKWSVTHGEDQGARLILENLDLVIRPGMRLAIVGPNGCGKSSLLGALARAAASEGTGGVRSHVNLRLGILDQSRTIPNGVVTLRDLLLPHGGNFVRYGGRSLHIASFLESFRFTHLDLQADMRALSGGQLARALLAATLLGEPNLLILDEPTNDLDLWILRDLEEGLMDFKGALLFTSHDRYFLGRLATDFLVLEKDPSPRGPLSRFELVADLEQATAAHADPSEGASNRPKSSASDNAESNSIGQGRAGSSKTRKQTYKDAFRQQHLEEQLPQWEQKAHQFNEALGEAFAKNEPHERTLSLSQELAKLNEQINAAYDELEEIMSRSPDDEDRRT